MDACPTRRAPLEPLPPFERHPDRYVIIPAIARRRHPVVEQRLRDIAAWGETAPWSTASSGATAPSASSPAAWPTSTSAKSWPVTRSSRSAWSIRLPLRAHPPLRRPGRDDCSSPRNWTPSSRSRCGRWGSTSHRQGSSFRSVGEFTLARVRRGSAGSGAAGHRSFRFRPQNRTPRSCRPAPLPSAPAVRTAPFSTTCTAGAGTAVFSGDIGCYSMGVLPPFDAMDMQSSRWAPASAWPTASSSAGAQEKVIAIIGDSTFFHAGLSPLASAAYNNGAASLSPPSSTTASPP
jgi:indolepyruvate ferredoxin oxidoreductase alpha subunit